MTAAAPFASETCTSARRTGSPVREFTTVPDKPKLPAPATRVVLIVVLLLGLGAARVLVQRAASKAELEAQSLEGQRIFVTTVTPTPSKSSGLLTLPATLRGDNETSIYARVNGYVRNFNVEIGDRVTKGERLAELDTPETDQQVRQAAAQVEQAKANVVLGKVALDRWKKAIFVTFRMTTSSARAGKR